MSSVLWGGEPQVFGFHIHSAWGFPQQYEHSTQHKWTFSRSLISKNSPETLSFIMTLENCFLAFRKLSVSCLPLLYSVDVGFVCKNASLWHVNLLGEPEICTTFCKAIFEVIDDHNQVCLLRYPRFLAYIFDNCEVFNLHQKLRAFTRMDTTLVYDSLTCAHIQFRKTICLAAPHSPPVPLLQKVNFHSIYVWILQVS